MRDDKDPGTMEMQLPKRRGRPPANGVAAQTAADLSRAYRQRRRAAVNNYKCCEVLTDMELLDRLRRAITSGNAQLAGIYARHIQQRYPYDV
ncbi:hypothetical protein [Xanthomonas vasicola]|uniref:hypothetical protein n=1 Tax=Xanthomonas vasicola TaxID=56459 RepID=UPI0001CC0B6A|nr:hypothetical protein [Xanthomonas vasicola]KFA18033.1 hypothetical protein KWS_0125495 [Xanthomonas vasicola pv. musacearum NCPPB 4384]AZR30966.1 hypothetical protein KWO_010920 [Xanthomonas vasicola pv. musacearum NCPPB 4379]KFA05582.1 hypothetical protein KWQ_0119630 [Xanthomonas vasicola pv. musacearum NCPPB 4380]KFA06775.1 hypothetical protein KWM_0116135 [Xanthomonas vasicola pv. musacearum NCPPB 2005]KFA16754.1 hypothetical protein A11G_0117335 [Xanthomonas vasicola pv. musacearum NCP